MYCATSVMYIVTNKHWFTTKKKDEVLDLGFQIKFATEEPSNICRVSLIT